MNASEEQPGGEEQFGPSKSKNMMEMIRRELEFFAHSISNHSLKLRNHYDNYQTLEVAHAIIEKINIHKT
jgi:hypothetical protein